MTVNFEKNVYFSNDMANAMVNVDNSQSHLDIKELDFQVTQKICLNGNWGWKQDLAVLESKDSSGFSKNAEPKVK